MRCQFEPFGYRIHRDAENHIVHQLRYLTVAGFVAIVKSTRPHGVKVRLQGLYSSSRPEVIIDNVPASAPEAPPLTAALISLYALSPSTFSPNAFMESGSSVLITIMVFPRAPAFRRPSSLNMMSTFCA